MELLHRVCVAVKHVRSVFHLICSLQHILNDDLQFFVGPDTI